MRLINHSQELRRRTEADSFHPGRYRIGFAYMGKLGSYARQNSLATALREMGRIEKTIVLRGRKHPGLFLTDCIILF